MEVGGNNRQKKPFFSQVASLFKSRRHHRVDNSRAEEEMKVCRSDDDNGCFGVADHAINGKASAYIDKVRAKIRASELLSDQDDAEKP
ncbi:hypothetical protein SLEP1_g51454 [Rubroshorea leprosula]|uniref:Uncharacterized protein n=1 Tax=Rubroshorea leprosula TaxID=152421 RepID=A0AAV5M6J5_9ROSI|nr:hypothetical protein SLEP1_g51454 [Rubroshorea leprosula]